MKTESQYADQKLAELEKNQNFTKSKWWSFDSFEEADSFRKQFLKDNKDCDPNNEGRHSKRRVRIRRREDNKFEFVLYTKKNASK